MPTFGNQEGIAAVRLKAECPCHCPFGNKAADLRDEICLLVFLSILNFDTARAELITGNELFRWWSDKDHRYEGLCLGYILGIHETNTAQSGACVPSSGVSRREIRDIVIRYLTTRPENRHLYAATLVLDAMRQAFPCCN